MVKRWPCIFKIIRILCVSIVFIALLVYVMPFAKELQDVDAEAYAIAKDLISNKLITNKNVKIYVGHTPLMWLFAAGFAEPIRARVYLRRDLLESKWLDIIIAHELGHIEVSYKEDEANFFAAKLVGKTRFLSYLAYLENKRKGKSRLSYLYSNGLYVGFFIVISDPLSGEKIQKLVNRINRELK